MQNAIIEHYPPVVKQIKEIQQIAKSEDTEFEKLHLYMMEVIENMFISTAGERGIEKFEKMLGITSQDSKSIDERRAFILFMMNRRKMSLTELNELLKNYAKDIRLIPDYNTGELEVLAGECVNDLKNIYDILDELLPLEIYVYFAMEIAVLTIFPEMEKRISLTTDIECSDIWKMKSLLKTFIQTIESFETASVTASKDLWMLDGSVLLDGSRLLDAEQKKEEL